MKIAELKEILAVLSDTDVTELTIKREDGISLRIRRGGPAGPATVVHAAPAPVAVASPMAQPGAPMPPVDSDAVHGAGNFVTSPFVGTFYRSPNPDSPPYVEVGQPVKKGQVLCIIEAMKIMNEIEAEVEGTVVEVLADDGQAVEFGQALFRIEPA
jgi:acetyl-CoA carboxylase biotin carboxyl carrier protein